MKTNVEEISSVKKKLTIEIEAEEVGKKFIAAYRILKKEAVLPGFRKGKIPQKLLEKYFNERVNETVTRDILNETLPKAFEETGVLPLNTPLIENDTVKNGQSFRYSALMEVRPEFDLKDYHGLEIEKEIFNVTDEAVNRQLEEIRKANGTLKSMDGKRAAALDDFMVIQYEGFEGAEPLQGIKAENFMIRIGSNDFHPDFEKNLIGLKTGDEKQIKVAFDQKYAHKMLAGKSVDFKIKVMDIKTLELPDLNDDFAKKLGADFTDLTVLKTKIKEEMTKREKDRIENELKQRLIERISGTVAFELPESLVESEIEHALENIKRTFTRSGSSLEKAGLSEDKLKVELRPDAEKRVKNFLVLAEIAKKNAIQIDEKELSEGLNRIAESLNQDPQIVRQFYETQQMLPSLRGRLLDEKTLNYLVDQAKIKEVEATK